MAKIIAAFTIFTFLSFAFSTVTVASDSFDSDSVLKSELVTVSDSDAVIPAVKVIAGNEQLPESEKTQTFRVRPIFPQAYPIDRHSFDRSTRIPLRFVRRHPCRKFKMFIPTKMTYGNDMILSDKTATVDLESIGDQVPVKWLEFKHKYGHRHHHYHHDKDEKFETKFEFDEKHKEKKREHKGGFMRRVRKFLKHTFD